MNKRTTVQEGAQAVQLFNREGIKTAAFFLVGYQGESEASVEMTFAHALSLPLDEISFNVPFPLPGSPLFSRLVVDTEADWNVAKETKFIYPSSFDEIWLRSRIDETLEAFRKKKLPNDNQTVGAFKACFSDKRNNKFIHNEL